MLTIESEKVNKDGIARAWIAKYHVFIQINYHQIKQRAQICLHLSYDAANSNKKYVASPSWKVVFVVNARSNLNITTHNPPARVSNLSQLWAIINNGNNVYCIASGHLTESKCTFRVRLAFTWWTVIVKIIFIRIWGFFLWHWQITNKDLIAHGLRGRSWGGHARGIAKFDEWILCLLWRYCSIAGGAKRTTDLGDGPWTSEFRMTTAETGKLLHRNKIVLEGLTIHLRRHSSWIAFCNNPQENRFNGSICK